MAQSPFNPLSPAGTLASPAAPAGDGSAEKEGHARVGSYQDAREVAQEASALGHFDQQHQAMMV